MKCIYCGEELKEGCIYCSNCGKEAQIVPDYNSFEDDYLKVLLSEEKEEVAAQKGIEIEQPKKTETQNHKKNKNKNKKTIILLLSLLTICIAGIIIVALVKMNIKNQHENSFDYQVEMAEKSLDDGDKDSAIAYYEKALKLDDSENDVKFALAELYMNKKDYDSAIYLYKEVLQKDKENKTAYKNLIEIYEKKDDVDSIIALSDGVENEDILELFSAYIVTPPVFNVKEGTYDDYQEIKLSSSNQDTIYYTLDGRDPIKNGKKYSVSISLDAIGEYEICAVSVNDKGIYSETKTQKYVIDIAAPDIPEVTPDGGTFKAVTSITVTVPEGCTAYYTWDSSDPNVNSTLYTDAIEMPEGNNVLSVILIDNKTEKYSDIYRGNFVYYPN